MALTAEASLRGRQCFWGAPTHDQSRIGWEELKKAAQQVATFNESRMEAAFPNGGKVRFRSLDKPSNARGFTADLWVIEEASFVEGSAFSEVILPTVLNTNGEIWSIYTPNGYDWTHEQEIGAHARGDAAVFVAPTVGADFVNGQLVRIPHPLENDQIPWEEILAIASQMTEQRFRQEILAQRVARAGRVFGAFDRARHVKHVPLDKAHEIALAVDFGYRTFACAGVQNEKSTGVMRVFAEGEWHELTTGQAINRIKEWFAWWPQIRYIDCDPAGEGTNIQTRMSDVELLRRAFPNAKVRPMLVDVYRNPEKRAEALRERMLTADGKVRFAVDPSCVCTIRALEESVYPEHKEGQAEKPEPLKDGKNDHLRDALGYHEACQYRMRAASFVN